MSTVEKDCSVSNTDKALIEKRDCNSCSIQEAAPYPSKRHSLFWTFAAFLILLTTPNFVMLLAHTIVNLNGSPTELLEFLLSQNPWDTLRQIWWPHILGNYRVWTIIGAFINFEAILMIILPGNHYTGNVTPKGNVPQYKNNSLLAFIVTVIVFMILVYYDIFNPSIIYDNFMYLIGALNMLGISICVMLFIKGKCLPSSTDVTDAGLIFGFFEGIELHPQILSCHIKVLINCRFGMMGWALLLLSYTYKQYQDTGKVSDSMGVAVTLQLIYIMKFFHWEQGYTKTMDIAHDRAGFYICWGCTVWLPCIYTSHTLYLVNHPYHLGLPLTTALMVVGVWSIYINYEADNQKLTVRKNIKCKIWGKEVEVIKAKYTTEDGQVKETVLLLSGWWGVARHFHYLPEIMAALCWSLPALFYSPIPYFYVMFLVTLLLHRLGRDDERCQHKYGSHWEEYCKLVPYKLFPGLF